MRTTVTICLCSVLAGCGAFGPGSRNLQNMPEGVDFLECMEISGQAKGIYTAAQGQGFSCIRRGFDDVREIEIDDGKVRMGSN